MPFWIMLMFLTGIALLGVWTITSGWIFTGLTIMVLPALLFLWIANMEI
jgi:hypothetical protein